MRPPSHTKTVEIEPVPPPDPFERVERGMREVVEFAGEIGPDILDAAQKLLAAIARRKFDMKKGRAA